MPSRRPTRTGAVLPRLLTSGYAFILYSPNTLQFQAYKTENDIAGRFLLGSYEYNLDEHPLQVFVIKVCEGSDNHHAFPNFRINLISRWRLSKWKWPAITELTSPVYTDSESMAISTGTRETAPSVLPQSLPIFCIIPTRVLYSFLSSAGVFQEFLTGR